MQALTHCDANVMSTRTTAGQFKCEFKGAMERYTWVRFAGKLTACHAKHVAMVSTRVGQWMSSGKDQRATHPISGVVMDLAVFKFCHSIDNDATAVITEVTTLKPQAPTPHPVGSRVSSRGRWRK